MNALLFASLLLAAVGTSPAASPAGQTVHIKNFSYHAPAITVTPGTTVRFVNDDGEAHTVTAVDKSFDSAGMDMGDAWTHTFTKPGSYAYFCELHPYMKGVVIVRAARGTTR